MPTKTTKKTTRSKTTRKRSSRTAKKADSGDTATTAVATDDTPPTTDVPGASQVDIAEVTSAVATSEEPEPRKTRRKTVKKKAKKRTRKRSAKAKTESETKAESADAPPDTDDAPPTGAVAKDRPEPARIDDESTVFFEAAEEAADFDVVDTPSTPSANSVDAAVAEAKPTTAESQTAATDAESSARETKRRRRGSRGGRRRSKKKAAAAAAAAEALKQVPKVQDKAPVEKIETADDDVEAEDEAPQAPRHRQKLGEFTGDRKSLGGKKRRTMIVETSGGEECRIAVLHEGQLEQLFIERASSQSHVGNIYKGRVTNVEASIQAVFVDFGLPKNGFLHISDVQPQYFPDHHGEGEEVGRKIPRHNRPPIQKCFRRGQEVIVQITKEGVGTKGPTLTSYLSIPGRFLVMMPGMHRHGVSRKIEDEEVRRKMRDMMKELDLPSGMGFIMRTAGVDQTKRELQRDLQYLMRLWRTVVDRIRRHSAPAELYRESDLITRTIRDVYTSDFTELIIDDHDQARRAAEFLHLVMPRTKSAVKVYGRHDPLFHRLGIEEEIERINMRHVPLPSGGSLVIDSTEAMVAIDVNSGRFRSPDDAEETALRINLEAAEEIARQLRLRDLGGLIVCDFIDMRHDRNKRKVERALRDALKKHKERARLLRMSAFGLIEITRQRQGPSLKRNIYFDCAHCRGTGLIKMPESVSLDVMRLLQLAAHHDQVTKVIVTVSSEVAFRILNTKRAVITGIEKDTGKRILVQGDESFTADQVECVGEDSRGRPVPIGPQRREPGRHGHT